MRFQVAEHRSLSFSYSPSLVRRVTTEPAAANRSSLSRRKRLSEVFRSFSLGKRSSVDSTDSAERRSVGKSGMSLNFSTVSVQVRAEGFRIGLVSDRIGCN